MVLTMYRDFVGNNLEVGDSVICLQQGTSNSWFQWARIVRFTPKMVVVLEDRMNKLVDPNDPEYWCVKRQPKALIRMPRPIDSTD